ncbi:MAG: MaoC family dehydratase N-terminal domain-containing protein [Deltaproteobacteria bacterium]|nr:MaoC family dehydratase N-terminal domain-containing protein [Deltaproteobacteria bacterium]
MNVTKKPLDPSATGKETAPLSFTYRWQDAALYALGIGAGQNDLSFVFEGLEGDAPMKVFPTYAVIPTYEACKAMFGVVGGDFGGVVHGGQLIRLHKPFAPSGTLSTIGKVASVGDLRRMAQVVFSTETRDEQGELVCETEWTIMYLLDGGFGGEAPPKSVRVRAPERAADWTVEYPTSPSQALLYRLSGDYNPLHADPRAAEKAAKVTEGRPILHGLCTYGYLGRALVEHECGGDPSKLKLFAGRFSKPVWPGETLIVSGWRDENDPRRVVVQAGTKEHPDEPVFTNSWAEIAR